MRCFICLLLLVMCFGCWEPIQNDIPPKQIRGAHLHEELLPISESDTSRLGWYYCNGHFNTAYYFVLYKNNNFSLEKNTSGCFPGTNSYTTVNGCFTIDGACLTLFPEQIITEDQYNMGKNDYYRDTIPYSLTNKTYLEVDYHIVESSGLHFLLSDTYIRPFASHLSNYQNGMEAFAEMYLEDFDEEKYMSHVFVQHPLREDKINLSDFDTLQIPEKYRHLFRKL